MGATPASHVSSRRYRRRIIGWGAAALVGVFGVGATVSLAEVEEDLETRSGAAVEGLNVDGVTASFSGQDGELTCAAPLPDPDNVRTAVSELRGVRDVTLDESCSRPVAERPDDDEAAADPPPAATDPPPTTAAPTTTVAPRPTAVLAALESDPRLTVFASAVRSQGLDDLVDGGDPVTVFAPTDDAFAALGPNFNAALLEADALGTVVRHHVVTGELGSAALADGELDTAGGGSIVVETQPALRISTDGRDAFVVEADVPAGGAVVHVVDRVLVPPDIEVAPIAEEFLLVARYDEAGIRLAGPVASSSHREELLAVARTHVAGANLDDRLDVDDEFGASDDEVAALAQVLDILPTTLVRGEVIVAADGLFVTGVAINTPSRAAVDAVAADLGAVTALADRPEATEDDAARLEQRLNEIVTADPIQFEPGSAELASGSGAVLDRLAVLAKSLGGVRITVTGHTDSAGVESDNLALSEERAAVVAFVLGLRGVPAVDLVIVGRGSNDPVLVDGVEDPVASRRVEFTVDRR